MSAGSPSPSTSSTSHKGAWIGAGAAIIAALITSYFTWLGPSDDRSEDASPTTSAPAQTTAGSPADPPEESSAPSPNVLIDAVGVVAAIQNTWDSESQSFVGVLEFPRTDSDEGAVNGPGEGETVIVVCQVLDGRMVTDTPYLDRPTSSTRWDRLSNGFYISDIYTNLDKPEGQPAPGLPECD